MSMVEMDDIINGNNGDDGYSGNLVDTDIQGMAPLVMIV